MYRVITTFPTVLACIIFVKGNAQATLEKEEFSITGTNVVEDYYSFPTGNVVPDFKFAFTISFDPSSSYDNGSLPLEAVTLDGLTLPGVVGIPPGNDFSYLYSDHELTVQSTNEVFAADILDADTLTPSLKQISYSAAPIPYYYYSRTGTVDVTPLGAVSSVPLPSTIFLFVTAFGIIVVAASCRRQKRLPNQSDWKPSPT